MMIDIEMGGSCVRSEDGLCGNESTYMNVTNLIIQIAHKKGVHQDFEHVWSMV